MSPKDKDLRTFDAAFPRFAEHSAERYTGNITGQDCKYDGGGEISRHYAVRQLFCFYHSHALRMSTW